MTDTSPPRYLQKKLYGWGHYPEVDCKILRPEFNSQILFPHGAPFICRGQGRSYGDASLSDEGYVISTERLNRFLDFDEPNGLLTAEAGVTLSDVLQTFIPKGFIPRVLPGTQYVTLGGCVAADVHGKNHHQVGSFGSHLHHLELLTSNTQQIYCSPQQEPELFWATIGGMGLTGFITELSFEMQPIETAYMVTQYLSSTDLENTFQCLEKADQEPYSVAWIDCLSKGKHLGRGVIYHGHHASKEELPKSIKDPLTLKKIKQTNIPFMMPNFLINRYSIQCHNSFYYHKHKNKTKTQIIDYQRFFFPLDRLAHWYRLYGSHGFLQYQFVLPDDHAFDGIQKILHYFNDAHIPIMLGVLKRLGDGNQSCLSFPMKGYTAAFDISLANPKLFDVLNEIDAIVADLGGRVYLAKDARMSSKHFNTMYPERNTFNRIKNKIDPNHRFSSKLSKRLMEEHDE